MPFADYSNFAACVAANKSKDDPDAYCGAIKHQVEDKAVLVLAETVVSKAVAGRVLRKHDTPNSPHSEHGRKKGGGAPKLPSYKPAGTEREVLADARSLSRDLPREVRDQFLEEFAFAREGGYLPEMQQVLDTWEKDPWGAGKQKGKSEIAMPGHRQPTNVGTENFPTDPIHDKRIPDATRALLTGRGRKASLTRAVTKALVASTETILSLHDTPNSPHKEHAKGKGTGLREEYLSKPPSLTPGDEAVEPGQSGTEEPPAKLDPKNMAQAVQTLDIGWMDPSDQGELVAEHLGVDPEEAISFFEGKARRRLGAREAAQTRRRGRPADRSYYD